MCHKIQVAAMTFSMGANLEFCFNCYNNDERNMTADAIRNIRYDESRSGSTHTGVATKCIYRTRMLDTSPDSECGLRKDSDCIDIIYLTDGGSYGPLSRSMFCEEVACLRRNDEICDRLKVYAFGIGEDLRQDELECIGENNADTLFNFASFDDLDDVLKVATETINKPGSKEECLVGIDAEKHVTALFEDDFIV